MKKHFDENIFSQLCSREDWALYGEDSLTEDGPIDLGTMDVP